MKAESAALASPRRRSLLFLARFLGLLVLFYAVVAWNPVNDTVVVPFTAGIARVSAAVLNVFGEKVSVAGTEIRSDKFAVQIENGCNGIEAALLFASAVLAFPAPWRRRVLGLLAGFAAIQALNLVRVVSLFWIGAHRPALFSSSHTVLWQSVVVLASVLLFLLWAARFAKEDERPDARHGA
ncbi:MAG TPA: exosortase H [Thermoanaerobaculia bacterium]|nr:exosortase H [Thermoanaerobaculia bacterium]